MQSTLVSLIRSYSEHNGIARAESRERFRIPIYIAQLFFHIVQKFEQDKGEKRIIKSELMSLGVVQKELMSFAPTEDEQKHDQSLKLSHFLQSVCGISAGVCVAVG